MRSGYQFYSTELNHQFSTRLSLERELRAALAQGELVVHYQPQVDLASGSIVAVEALVRWQHPTHGLLLPERFVDLAEETGLIAQVDDTVQRQAFDDAARWRAQGNPDLRVAVNVSAVQAAQDNFVQRFAANLDAAGLPGNAVIVEITENTLLRDIEAIVPRLKALERLGVTIAVDDFGTGYSSVGYLHQFPVSALKVDRSFVGDIRADDGGAPVLDAITAMAGGLRLSLAAEGVENHTQLGYLAHHGCAAAQGFVFSRPLPANDMSRVLAEDPYRELVAAERRPAVAEAAPSDAH
jgi:EAL domain-containing protein (putative c-di-GMP-specific phosphodiesterase class I)